MSKRIYVLLPFALALSGCRLGNYEKDPPGPGSIAGYYETLKDPTITLCATRPVVQSNGVTQDQTNCAQTPASHVDPLIDYVMTNPVDLTFDSSSGFFVLSPNPEAEPNTPFLILPLVEMAQNTFGYSGSIATFTPMQTHPGCQLALSTVESASTSTGGPYSSGSDLPMSGRLAMDLTWDYVPSGSDCSYISACYSDPSKCSSDDQGFVQQFYGNFVDVGLLSASDLSKVEKLEYQVSYH